MNLDLDQRGDGTIIEFQDPEIGVHIKTMERT
jgi:hypothetical protein